MGVGGWEGEELGDRKTHEEWGVEESGSSGDEAGIGMEKCGEVASLGRA